MSDLSPEALAEGRRLQLEQRGPHKTVEDMTASFERFQNWMVDHEDAILSAASQAIELRNNPQRPSVTEEKLKILESFVANYVQYTGASDRAGVAVAVAALLHEWREMNPALRCPACHKIRLDSDPDGFCVCGGKK